MGSYSFTGMQSASGIFSPSERCVEVQARDEMDILCYPTTVPPIKGMIVGIPMIIFFAGVVQVIFIATRKRT